MTALQVRNFLLGLGLLVAAFGVIYAFTPGGFSWSLLLVGLLMMVPWLVTERRRRRAAKPAPSSGAPRWHPEYDGRDR